MTCDKKKSLKDGPLFQKYNHHKGKQSLTVPAWLPIYSTEGRRSEYRDGFPRICLLALLTQRAEEVIKLRKKSWAADFNHSLFQLNAVLKVPTSGSAVIRKMAEKFQVRYKT